MESLRILLLAILLLAHLEMESTAAAERAGVVEMKVKTVVIDPNAQSPVVVLEGVAAKEFLPIWIDVPEARAISLEIEQVKTPRPLTHDLIRNILNGLGAKVNRITITDLLNNTYIATISMAIKGQESEIDSRPSDAIAIALRMKAPIYVSLQVIEKSKPPAGSTTRSGQTQKRLGALGIWAQELTPELAKLMDSQSRRGVIITDVITGSAAMKADIQRGDIITKLNDQPVLNTAALETIIQALSAPGRVKVELIRKGKPTTAVIDLP
jgi:bifunctional DNase/RNase